eukprot:8037235-Alexandrium_andersonii.AAC.1
MASKSVPEALEGCVLRRFPRSCRICRRNELAGAPEALLRGPDVSGKATHFHQGFVRGVLWVAQQVRAAPMLP